jgi:ATP-dependent helicase/nuclease subunit A
MRALQNRGQAMTAKQRLASDPNVSAWVGASAGTGKTHVLTSRVLRLMLAGTPPGKILCLTFTKAAAAEMSNRIHHTLAAWVTLDEAALGDRIFALQNENATETQRQRARQLFAEVLDVPGGLKIQTIHSFCQSLLGRFPLEAGEPPHFQVLDERTAGEHLRSARDSLLMAARANPQGAVATALAKVSRLGTENAFTDVVRELVGERAGLERLFRRFSTLPGITVALRRALGLDASATYGSIVEAAVSGEAFDGAGLKSALAALAQGSKTDVDRGVVIGDWLAASPKQRGLKLDEYKHAFLTRKGEIKANLATKGALAANPAIAGILACEAERLFQLAMQLKLFEVAENTAALLILGQEILREFAAAKRRHAVLDYDDLILATSNLLKAPGIGPWVLYKLDGGIDHILIDEAQDTNPEQWQVVRALADEFFTGESARGTARTLFAVGDVKQSIYSFQRADPREFHLNARRFSARSQAVNHEFCEVKLDLSFRSTTAVLDFVDQVFSSSEARDGLAFEDIDIRHEAARKGHAGLIELWPSEKPDAAAEERDWTPPLAQAQAREADARLAVRIAEKISGWLKAGEILPSQGRPVRAGDVLVLVRRRSGFVDYLIRALKQRGVAVAGSDRMVLTDQLGVMDLMALARFVLLPEDDLNLAVVLKGPLIGWDDEALYKLAYGRGDKLLWSRLTAAAEKDEKARPAYDYLAGLLARADFTPPFEFFGRVLERPSAVAGFKGRQILLARLGEDAGDPIDEFLSHSLAFEQNHPPSLQGFLGWLETGEAEIKRDLDQGRDEVRIMTVHGAKGLQAPIVFLPDTTQAPKQGSRLIWADAPGPGKREADRLVFWPAGADNEVGLCADARAEAKIKRDQEYRRLLYVALTRAEDRLYVGGWENSKGRDKNCWYDMIEAAMSRTAERIEIDDGGYVIQRIESPQEMPPKVKAETTSVLGEALALPAWALQKAPAEALPLKPLSPSRPVGEEPPCPSPLAAAGAKKRDDIRFRRGRLIHRLLQTLPDMAPETRAEAARRFLGQPALALDGVEVEAIAEEVLRVMTMPGLDALFGAGSRAEVGVAGLVEGVAIAGQVDRLTVGIEEILIVDYKTNRPPPERVQETAPVYVRQMAAYQRVLRSIYPGHAVTCALLWTDGPALMTLPQVMLDMVVF